MQPNTQQPAIVAPVSNQPNAQAHGPAYDYKGHGVEDGTRDPRSVNMPMMMTETGFSGDTIWRGIIQGAEYNQLLIGKAGIKVWDQMRKSDATVMGLLKIVKGPIIAADWAVREASDSPRDEEIAEFVRFNLFTILSWEDILREALTSLDFGFWIGEKVYAPTKWNGKTYICIQKIGTRKQNSVYSWSIPSAFAPDSKGVMQATGEAPGVTQLTTTGQLAYLPIDKLIIVTHDREANNYEGTSLLRPAYIHWSMKQKMYKIDLVAQEKHGVGVPVIEYDPNLQNDDLNKAIEAAQNIRASEKGYILKPKGTLLEMLDMKSHQLISSEAMIQHHNRQILMAGLAAFTEMGSHGGSGGAHASSNDQSRLFELSEEMEAKNLAKTFMNMFIRELVDLNYSGVTDYPTLDHGKIGEDDVGMLATGISSLVSSGALTMDPDLEDYIRDLVGATPLPDDYKADYNNRPLNVSPNNRSISDVDPKNPDGGARSAAVGNTPPAGGDKPAALKATEAEDLVATAKSQFDRIEAILASAE